MASKRAPFNQTCDLIWGPGTATPGVVRMPMVQCRVVLQGEITSTAFPMNMRVAWITMDRIEPNGPYVTSVVPGGPTTFDYTQSDVVAIPSGGAPVYCIVDVEHVVPFGGPNYWRASVVHLPFPP